MTQAAQTTTRGNPLVAVRDVKQGTYLQLKEGGPMFVRQGYDRETKKYELGYFDEVGRSRFVKGTTLAITDADF